MNQKIRGDLSKKILESPIDASNKMKKKDGFVRPFSSMG